MFFNGSMEIVYDFDLESLAEDESFKSAFFTISQIILLLDEDFDSYAKNVEELERLITLKLDETN